jgi:hypothetical protein
VLAQRASGFASSPPMGSTPTWSSPPSLGRSSPSCGRLSRRCPSEPEVGLRSRGGLRRGAGLTQTPTTLRGGPGRPSRLDRGRRSTETSKMVGNPGTSAGSTVGATGPTSAQPGISGRTNPCNNDPTNALLTPEGISTLSISRAARFSRGAWTPSLGASCGFCRCTSRLRSAPPQPGKCVSRKASVV